MHFRVSRVSRVSRLSHQLRQILDPTRERDLSPYRARLRAIEGFGSALAAASDLTLLARAQALRDGILAGTSLDEAMPEAFALVREAAQRALGICPFDEQMLAGLAMARGRVVELATGEGKTLAAVAPAFLAALEGRGFHILTFNDYLARRDAHWMGPVYHRLGLRVAFVQEGMTVEERRLAYGADVTYLTAKEAGFDLLRDGLAFTPAERVHRPFHAALVDEADSILIDEARIPLVIAGNARPPAADLERLARLVTTLSPNEDFDTDEYAHNIALTEAGLARAEASLGRGSLHAPENLLLFARLGNALHAQRLLTRDVDYIVRGQRVELVDDATGRVAEKRQWPDGLQAAVEAKEGVPIQEEGRILGSVTLQHFLRLYPKLAGMTATATSSAEELHAMYGKVVTVVPTHREVIRVDHPDLVFTHKDARLRALVDEILRTNATGRPVLVGTASVADSDLLAAAVRATGVVCEVLNARNDEAEADIIARAGAPGAVTISTNMAGRGTDIRLGGRDGERRNEVVALGGLSVLGANRHATKRIDRQLRGRAGRQGDPGSSRFFVSLEDDILVRYGIGNLLSARGVPSHQDEPLGGVTVLAEIDRAQRIIDGEASQTRRTLFAYSEPSERQRRAVQDWRACLLEGTEKAELLTTERAPRVRELCEAGHEALLPEIERRVMLAGLDHAWADFLALSQELREDSSLLAFAGRVPLAEYHRSVSVAFLRFEERVCDEALRRFDALEIGPQGVDWKTAGLSAPGATWTYLVNDNPFGASDQVLRRRAEVGFFVAFYAPVVLLGALRILWKRRKARQARRHREANER